MIVDEPSGLDDTTGLRDLLCAEACDRRVGGHRQMFLPLLVVLPEENNAHFAQRYDAEDGLPDHPDGPPDAVFCCNDLVAIGAIRTLLSSGIRVPEDIAVVGFDDIEAGRYLTPSLTTIAPDRAAIAKLAVERLVARPRSIKYVSNGRRRGPARRTGSRAEVSGMS